MKKRLAMTMAAGALAAAMMAGGAAAQDEASDQGAVVFDFSHTPSESGHEAIIDATDPRASGDLTVGSGDVLATDELVLASVSLRLANDEGIWTGTGRHYIRGEQEVTAWEMTGEGGYNGLSLFMFLGGEESWGVIAPSEAIPPYPALPVE